jgi:hypothetical protein
VDYNQLTTLPPTVCQLACLKELNAANNKIYELCGGWHQLTGLRVSGRPGVRHDAGGRGEGCGGGPPRSARAVSSAPHIARGRIPPRAM